MPHIPEQIAYGYSKESKHLINKEHEKKAAALFRKLHDARRNSACLRRDNLGIYNNIERTTKFIVKPLIIKIA